MPDICEIQNTENLRQNRKFNFKPDGWSNPPTTAGRRKIMIGERIQKLEKFFGVKKPKGLNEFSWLEKLYEMEQEWEEEHGEDRKAVVILSDGQTGAV